MDCDEILEFDHCAAAISKSETDQRIVVAFEGSDSKAKLIEQIITAFTGTTYFAPTNGKVKIKRGN